MKNLPKAYAVPGGVLLCLLGAVWVLQGVGILPGSFMTGQLFWAAMGAVCLLIGGGLLYLSLGPRRA